MPRKTMESISSFGILLFVLVMPSKRVPIARQGEIKGGLKGFQYEGINRLGKLDARKTNYLGIFLTNLSHPEIRSQQLGG